MGERTHGTVCHVAELAHDDWLWNESSLAKHDQNKNLTSLASQPERSPPKIRKKNRPEGLDLRRVNPICIVDEVKRETRQLTDERKTDCALDETNRALFGESTSTQHLVFCSFFPLEQMKIHPFFVTELLKTTPWSSPHQRLLCSLTTVTVICNLGLSSTCLTNCSNPVEHFLIDVNSPSRDTLRRDENSWMWVEQRNLEKRMTATECGDNAPSTCFPRENLGEVGPMYDESHSDTYPIYEVIGCVFE